MSLDKSAAPLGSERVTVVLTLAGDSVAAVRSQAPDKKIADADRRAIEQSLRAQQDALRISIEANGGEVLGQFQNAINGIKVRARADRLVDLSLLPGVVAVKPVATYKLDNVRSVPFIGAPAVWNGTNGTNGFHGEGVKVAVIDTGIDWTHANFGGPGTAADYTAAHAVSTGPADPRFFGPGAPKVKGGTDLVGDDYNADPNDPAFQPVPHPDPNPLDCNGHGSHVAGTAAGFGVDASGHTFHGPYNANTDANPSAFIIGPGVAPLADLYSVRVFGCAGSTDVVLDAIDWAVQHDMDVINMSLGSAFTPADSADAEASNNAVDAGVMVATSAGNAGFSPYIVGGPSSGDKAISTAAVDSTQSFPGDTLTLSTGNTVTAIDANGIQPANLSTLPIVVLRNANGTISLGCNKQEYINANVTGKLAVVIRGTCARVARAVFGQQAGAAAVLMINNSGGLPPFEGPITSNPDTGEQFNVTIPFLGVRGGAQPLPATNDGAKVAAATSTTFTNATLPNAGFRAFASFTSGGPRYGDGFLKPDLSGPGVSIFSTGNGMGSGGVFISGTSMASPHVAGVAALTVQSHPGWDTDLIRAAIVNTADASQLTGFSIRLGGGGLVQPNAATRTSVVATTRVPGRNGRDTNAETNLSFGAEEFTNDFRQAGDIELRNLGSSTATFNVSAGGKSGAAHSVTVNQTSITLRRGERRNVRVEVAIPAATAGDSSAFSDVSGFIHFTPATANDNAGVALHVPYYVVALARSQVDAHLTRDGSAVALQNNSRDVVGKADFYAWGLSGKDKKSPVGIRAVGVQSFPADDLLVFAINTFAASSNPAANEYDVVIDNDGDGTGDFLAFAADRGALTTGSNNGQLVSGVKNLKTGAIVLEFLAPVQTDTTTIEIAVAASDVGVTSATPRFAYSAHAFDGFTGAVSVVPGTAKFNAFHSSISTGGSATLGPRESGSVPVTLDAAELAQTPALGQMVVSTENSSGKKQAFLLKLDGTPDDT
ncbi:MAG TPA: S8 family serine peptidase [Myxococcales bacterium]|nr:S8 family serine peptidase [Myxococcales bacterium]